MLIVVSRTVKVNVWDRTFDSKSHVGRARELSSGPERPIARLTGRMKKLGSGLAERGNGMALAARIEAQWQLALGFRRTHGKVWVDGKEQRCKNESDGHDAEGDLGDAKSSTGPDASMTCSRSWLRCAMLTAAPI